MKKWGGQLDIRPPSLKIGGGGGGVSPPPPHPPRIDAPVNLRATRVLKVFNLIS